MQATISVGVLVAIFLFSKIKKKYNLSLNVRLLVYAEDFVAVISCVLGVFELILIKELLDIHLDILKCQKQK